MNINNENIGRVEIFDFDGTLVDTQLPDTGKPIWKEKTGNDWPHIGWWGRVESLDLDVFEQKPKEEIVEALTKANATEGTLTVLLTGRRKKTPIMDAVKAILTKNSLTLDEYRFNYGGETGDNKIEQMSNLLELYPNVRTMTMFDDRVSHFEKFNEFGNGLVKSGRLDEWELIEVHNPQWTK